MTLRIRTMITGCTMATMLGGIAVAESPQGSPLFRNSMHDFHADLEEISMSFNAAGEKQFRANIDNGGDVSAWRAHAALEGFAPITPDLDIGFSVSYGMDYYRFSGGPTGLGGLNDPWDDIHTANFGATFGWSVGPDAVIFGGPVFQFAGESGAGFGDAFIGGGIVGAEWRFSDDLSIGGGVGVVSQIKRSVRVFPVIKLDWQITDALELVARTHPTAAGDIGGELIFDRDEGWQAAIGATYRFRRFRLDTDGPEPNGIGQERALPFYGRFSLDFHPDISATLYGGVVLAGALRLEDSGGSTIGSEDYDPAGLIGLNVNVRF